MAATGLWSPSLGHCDKRCQETNRCNDVRAPRAVLGEHLCTQLEVGRAGHLGLLPAMEPTIHASTMPHWEPMGPVQ